MRLDAEALEMVAANEADWDARAALHAASRFYGRPAEYWFGDYEWEDLGPLDGRDILHLQCHLGTETIAFARRGARTVGLDLSSRSLEEARKLAGHEKVDIEYVHANVYDAVEALEGRQFDVVYTGKGALCYLPDLAQWADVVHQLLKPGGSLYIVEFHPLLNAMGPVALPGDTDDLTIRNDYLEGRGAIAHDSTVTYTGDQVPGRQRSFEWMRQPRRSGHHPRHHRLPDHPPPRVRSTPMAPLQRHAPNPQGLVAPPGRSARIPLLYALLATRRD